MKRLFSIGFLLLLLTACGPSVPADASKETFHVAGNCGMCKRTIEKSLKVDGVYKSSWNRESKMLTVWFASDKISLEQIKRKVADAGYDNDLYRADSLAYENLHSCCKYERE